MGGDRTAPVPEGGYERFNAHYCAYAALDLRAAEMDEFAQSKRREHDAQDIPYLMHIAHPALLATADKGLIRLVDESKSFQAPWVRTIGELLTDPLPGCLPWGDEARELAYRWERRPRRDLALLDELALGSIRAERTDPGGGRSA